MDSYKLLTVAALLPVLVSVILYTVNKRTSFGKLGRNTKQIIYGIIFGALAILGTELGIPMNGAQVNCRDAAVLIAGLMFGAPAGIIAGIIGGVERWIAVAWGVGTFTRVACTVSTVFAGFYAAALRKFMFDDKKPGWVLAFAIGIVMEVFHLTMVFLTNMATPEKAMAVVEACALPIAVFNGISVMLTAIALTLLAKESVGFARENVRITQMIQRRLLVTVLLAFIVTSLFLYRLQDTVAQTQADALLTNALEDVAEDIIDTSDENLLALTHIVKEEAESSSLDDIAKRHDIAEISIIGKDGIISDSTMRTFIGFDMSSGSQSAEFLCLLDDADEYVQSYGPISFAEDIMMKYAGVKTETGFIQVGYDAEHFQKDIDSQVVNLARNRHVGYTGFVMVIDEKYNVISAPDSLDLSELSDDEASTIKPAEGVTLSLLLNGEKCLCRYMTTEGYIIVSVLPEAEVLQLRNIVLYVNTFMEIIVFAVLFALIYLLIKKVVVNQIKNINSSLARIAGGDLAVEVNVRSSAEFASLSDDINSTVSTLKRYIAEASARIDKELQFARDIQTSALPNSFPAFPKRKDFDIYASMDPAKEVGGDFYDFYITGSDTLHFLIADVSGKGIPAAMFMMRAKTELKTLTESDISIGEVFTRGNASLCEGNDANMFVTAWQGSLDLNTGLLRFANAGHNPPLVKHADGSFEYLRTRAGFVLAGLDGVRYKPQELQLQPGDIVYLYTDGVTEATNADMTLFGEQRLLDALNSQEFDSAEAICKFIKAEVDGFVGDAPQFDDITMVALKYIGTPPAPSITFDEATLSDIPAATEFAEAEMEKLGCPLKTVYQFNVAIDEIFSNIVKYGYAEKPGPVTLKLIEKDDPHRLYVRFEDEGMPYNPLTKEDPDVTLSAEERGIGGLGIYMVKKTMDDMRYKYENGKNILTIMKKL